MIDVTLVFSPHPREVFEQTLRLTEGATLRDAVLASDLPSRYPALDWVRLTPGVWGRAAAWNDVLQAGDRMALCRPLIVDPKVARRERFARQGARGTGLFAKRRPGAKPGY